MKKIQKIIIIVYCAVVAVACIYVPWVSLYVPSKVPISEIHMGLPLSLGYSLFWKPLVRLAETEGLIGGLSVVDIKRVILELIAITAVFGILFVLTLRPKKVLPGS